MVLQKLLKIQNISDLSIVHHRFMSVLSRLVQRYLSIIILRFDVCFLQQ